MILFPLATSAWHHPTLLTQSSLPSLKLSNQATISKLILKASADDDDEYIAERKKMFDINDSEDIGERTKLISESIAPWRTLRLFLYGSAASGAFVGGLITLSGAIAAMNGGGLRPDVDMNTEVSLQHFSLLAQNID